MVTIYNSQATIVYGRLVMTMHDLYKVIFIIKLFHLDVNLRCTVVIYYSFSRCTDPLELNNDKLSKAPVLEPLD